MVSNMKLYQFAYSPYAAKVRKVLELKGLAYECIEVPYLDRREVVRWTNQVVVPVLVDGDRAIHDSPAIAAYLDDRYSPNLRPGVAAAIESWSDTTLEDIAFRIASPAVEPKIAALNGDRDDARAMYRFVKERKFGAGCIDAWARDQTQLTARLCAMVESLRPSPFLLGDAPTLADAAVYGNFWMLEWAMPGWVWREVPHLADWYARIDKH
jgi:glutathione S-transferase